MIIDDIKRLLSAAYVSYISLLGGEIFTHPQLDEILEMLLNLDEKLLANVKAFSILSNATVIPHENIWGKIARLKNMFMLVSVYPVRQRLEEYKALCEKYGIALSFSKHENFYDLRLTNLHSRDYTISELKHMSKVCPNSGCFSAFDGKFYRCSVLCNLHEDRLIPDNDTDYIDIRNTPIEELPEKLEKFIYGTEYLEGCQYCDGAPCAKIVPRAIQLK